MTWKSDKWKEEMQRSLNKEIAVKNDEKLRTFCCTVPAPVFNYDIHYYREIISDYYKVSQCIKTLRGPKLFCL